MPDPKIQQVMDKISALLKEADLAGIAFVASPSHTQYLHHIEASWTACKMEAPGHLRLRCKRADYPTKEQWQETMRLSVGTIMSLMHVTESTAQQLYGVVRALGSKMDISHVDIDEGPIAPRGESPVEDRATPSKPLEAPISNAGLELLAAAAAESKTYPLPPMLLDVDESVLTSLIGTLQLAMRHPRFKQSGSHAYRQMRELIDKVIRQLPENRPALKRLLKMGDREEYDQP